MHRLYTNTTPFRIRNLSILGFWYSRRSWSQAPQDQGTTVFQTTFNPHYPWCLYFQIRLLPKFICDPKINTRGAFAVLADMPRAVNTRLSQCSRSQLRWNKACTLSLCPSSQTVNKCPFHSWFITTFFEFLYFLWISLFKVAPKHRAEVLSSVPEHKKAVTCLMEEIH